ncbi:MAG: hypothetical protein AAF721_30245 [Myxococcota bacterium]
MGRLVFAWGILGVTAILTQALVRLAPLAYAAIEGGLSAVQWGLLVVWVAMMAHAEGYRGFHRRFSPRVVARALWLRDNPRPLFAVFAPLFCMSLFHATKRGVWTARILVLGILGLILVVRTLSQPWRGIIDAGVVVGLAIGLASMLGYAVRALLGTPPPVPPDLPEATPDR